MCSANTRHVFFLSEMCCGVLRCVAVCCSVLQCGAVCCSVLQCVAGCCRVLQRGAVCCSVVQCLKKRTYDAWCMMHHVLQHIACCNTLHVVTHCMLQLIACCNTTAVWDVQRCTARVLGRVHAHCALVGLPHRGFTLRYHMCSLCLLFIMYSSTLMYCWGPAVR